MTALDKLSDALDQGRRLTGYRALGPVADGLRPVKLRFSNAGGEEVHVEVFIEDRPHNHNEHVWILEAGTATRQNYRCKCGATLEEPEEQALLETTNDIEGGSA